MSRHFDIRGVGNKRVLYPVDRLIKVAVENDIILYFDDPTSERGYDYITIHVDAAERANLTDWLSKQLSPNVTIPIVIEAGQTTGVRAVDV